MIVVLYLELLYRFEVLFPIDIRVSVHFYRIHRVPDRVCCLPENLREMQLFAIQLIDFLQREVFPSFRRHYPTFAPQNHTEDS